MTNEPAADGSPPQGSTAATPFARNRETLIPDRARSGGPEEETRPAPPTVLTTSFSVDPLKSTSTQAEDNLPTLSKRTGQEPSAASRNNHNNSGAAATTVPGEFVPTSRPELGAPAGQVARRVPQTKSGPSSYLRGGKPPSPQAHAPATADAFDATHEYCTPAVVFFWHLPLASRNGHLPDSR